MTETIRLMRGDDLDAIVQLSLAAWAPVFESFRSVLGPAIYARVYPDWTTSQAAAVASVCTDGRYTVWVADVDGLVAAFIACQLNQETRIGEVYMLAVHPDQQNRGLGTRLNLFVLDRMRELGIDLAEVGTGGDPGHAAARRSYEKAGYTALPLVHYYKSLNPPAG